jgi:hypothetical protein
MIEPGLKIKPYDAYCIHNAVRLHFQSEKYDYFRYNGKTRVVQPSEFTKNKQRFDYLRLVRKCPTAIEVQNFCACNYAMDRAWFITKNDTTESLERFSKWKRFYEMPFHFFAKDLSKARDRVIQNQFPANALWNRVGENNPILYDLWLSGEIQTETVCVLDHIMGIFQLWDDSQQYDPCWEDLCFSVPQYTPFVMGLVVDLDEYRDKVKEIVMEIREMT